MKYNCKHGTHSGYSHGCRCDACVKGHRDYEREAARRRRRVRYGIEVAPQKKTSSEPAREHILFLASKGIGLGAIANQVGTNRATIQYIKRGKFKNISTQLSNKILAVPSIPREPNAFTDAEPIKILLTQLKEKGVSKKDVAIAAGINDGRLVVKNKMRVWKYQKVESVCKEMLRLRP